MPNNRHQKEYSLTHTIQLAPRYHPRKVEITEAENGFTVGLWGGEEFCAPPAPQKLLVAKSREEALGIAEGFLTA